MLMVRETAWSKARASGLRSDWQDFDRLHYRCLAMIQKAKSSHYLSSLSDCNGNPAKSGRMLKPYLIVTIQHYLTKYLMTLPIFLTNKNCVTPLISTLLLQAAHLS